MQSAPLLSGPVAQWLEQGTHNPLVAGSNPAGPTILLLPCLGCLQLYSMNYMKKIFYTLLAVIVAGCGESQLERRAKVEEAGVKVEIQAAEEQPESSVKQEEEKPQETPQRPQTNRRPDEGQSRPGQGRGGRGGGFGGMRNLLEGLGLNEEQQAKMEEINAARQEEMRSVFEELRNGGGDREAMMAKFREFGEKYQKDIEAILTDEQKTKLAELREQQPQGGQGRPGQGGRGQGSRSNQFASLGVNEDQQKKLDTAREALSTQMREVFLDRDTPREEREPKIAAVREAYEAKLKEILTEEQYQKWKEQSSRGNRGPGQGGAQGQGRRPSQGGAQGQGRRPGQGGAQGQGRRPGQGGAQGQGRRPGQGGAQGQGRRPGQGGPGSGGRTQPPRQN